MTSFIFLYLKLFHIFRFPILPDDRNYNLVIFMKTQ